MLREKNVVTKNLHFLQVKLACLLSRILCIWKFLKKRPIGRPIVAGYDWILTPASIFAGHFLKEFYSKFDSILSESFSIVKFLENAKFDEESFSIVIYSGG